MNPARVNVLSSNSRQTLFGNEGQQLARRAGGAFVAPLYYWLTESLLTLRDKANTV